MKQVRVYYVYAGNYRWMVAAKNQKEAAKLMETSVYYLRKHGGLVADPDCINVALSEAGRVWVQAQSGPIPQPWLYAGSVPS